MVPTFEALALQDITEPRVRRWRKRLLDAGVGEVTVAKACRLLKAIMSTAVDDGTRHPRSKRLIAVSSARPRERGLKPERGAERAAAERSGAALI